MPHPERASEALLGSDDGMLLMRSLVESMARVGRRRVTLLEERPVDVPLHRRLGLTDAELDAIHDRLEPRAERSRARHVQRDVERALLVQELEARSCARCPPPAAMCSPARARTRAS